MAKALKERKKAKRIGVTGFIAAIAVIAAIFIAAAVFIHIATLPKADTDSGAIYVGGMLTSGETDYQSESAAGLEKNAVIKMMQMVWRFCDSGDKKKHAAQTPPGGVTEISDLAYIDDGNHYHLLDIMYPENTAGTDKLPVIIDIHGGGWMYADKDLNDYYCMGLAARGYVVFNISYRLVPDVTVKEQLQDIACALKWIEEKMADYPCGGDNILLTGDSAGGQLAVYSAVLLQSEALRGVFGTAECSLKPTALLLTSPVAYMKSGGLFSLYTKPLWGSDYKEQATYDYMDLDEIIDYAALPPTYLITSSGDSLAHAQTVRAYELLKEKGVECELADYGKAAFGESLPHVFSVLYPFDEAGMAATDSALAFFQNVISEKETSKE